MKVFFPVLLVALLALSACGTKNPDEAPSGAIPQSQLKALEKAQGVEDLLMETDEKRKAAADE